MSNVELVHAVREFKEYQQLREETEARLEELKAAIANFRSTLRKG